MYMYMYMCICIYVYIHIHTYIHTYIYIYTYMLYYSTYHRCIFWGGNPSGPTYRRLVGEESAPAKPVLSPNGYLNSVLASSSRNCSDCAVLKSIL